MLHELRSAGIFLAPWVALVALSIYILHTQDRLVTERLLSLEQRLEAQTAVLADIRDAVGTAGLVVPPFRRGGQDD